jgi:hypothetical protein
MVWVIACSHFCGGASGTLYLLLVLTTPESASLSVRAGMLCTRTPAETPFICPATNGAELVASCTIFACVFEHKPAWLQSCC